MLQQASWATHNGECPKCQSKLGEILVKSKTINVHNKRPQQSSQNHHGRGLLSLSIRRELWGSESLNNYVQQWTHLRPGLHNLFQFLLLHRITLNYTWSFKIIKPNLKALRFANNKDI